MNYIAFFGASVTQQKNGYVDKFNNLIQSANNLPSYQVEKHGYGSMHLCDAGICFLNNVLVNNPKYLFVDWFVTGWKTNNYNHLSIYLDTIVNKCLINKCIPIFLILDRTDIENRVEFNNLIKQYVLEYGIHLIEITNCLEQNLILKDSVHTTEYGSEHYANIVYNYFLNNIYDKKFNWNKLMQIKPTQYSNIKQINYDNLVVTKQIYIEGNSEIVGIYQTIGPHSGICEIIYNNELIEKFNMWDQWCNYERDNIKLELKINGNVKINITNENFDTTEAKLQNINLNKKLIIKTIFYIGDISKIEIE